MSIATTPAPMRGEDRARRARRRAASGRTTARARGSRARPPSSCSATVGRGRARRAHEAVADRAAERRRRSRWPRTSAPSAPRRGRFGCVPGASIGTSAIVRAGETVVSPARSARLHRMALHEWTVAGGLIETDAGVLLVRNVRRGGFEDWSTPGGVIDADDADLLAGLTREVEEETGLRRARVDRSALRGARARARHGLADALRGASRGRVRRRAARRRSRRHRRRGRVRARRTSATSTCVVVRAVGAGAARARGCAIGGSRRPGAGFDYEVQRHDARLDARGTQCLDLSATRDRRRDPARRSRRVLRVGRAARRPDAARPAGDRRRARRPGRGRGRELRSARVRRALGDADGRARRACPHGGVRLAALRPLRRRRAAR